MKYLVLFSLKNNEKVFENAVCYSRDWLKMAGKHADAGIHPKICFQVYFGFFFSLLSQYQFIWTSRHAY